MSILKLDDITIRYKEKEIFKNFSCEFEEGKFYTLLGPSGCGKTTLLRAIAGFVKLNEGSVTLEGKDVSGVSANLRNVNTIFQDYALFEHLNVFENIAFGLRMKKTKESDIYQRVIDALEKVNLSENIYDEINELSGGQKQRIAIARAIINEPKILLLDEPLSALDLKLRTEMQYVLRDLQQTLGITFIFVTHDQEEALAMSDYIYVLNKGKIEHEGEPTDIYDEPNNRFVADFIGNSNIVEGTYIKQLVVEFCGTNFQCIDSDFADGELVDIVIRPEDLNVTEVDLGDFNVVVDTVLYKGMNYEISTHDIHENRWLIHTTKSLELDMEIGITIEAQDIHVMKVLDET